MTDPSTFAALAATVIAVPPLARTADLSIDAPAVRTLAAHLRAGGIATLLYGGNANLYDMPLREYAGLLALLEELSGDGPVVPSAGPDYGRLMDQAPLLRRSRFRTAMVLPQDRFAVPSGVERAVRRFADAFGQAVILYLRSERFLRVEQIARLTEDGTVLGVKYAIERPDPSDDAFLAELVKALGAGRVVSGDGERPALAHMRDFGLGCFTSGAVCVAPRAAGALLAAARRGDWQRAEQLRERFMPFDRLRTEISPAMVLHEAVELAGVAATGPHLPMLDRLGEADRHRVAEAARQLLDLEATVTGSGR